MTDRVKMDAAAVEQDRRLCDTMRAAIGMQSFGRLVDIAYWIMLSAHVPGDVCEFGCYRGQTAALMMELTKKNLWLYDGFQGNPEATSEDGLPENAAPYHAKGGNKAGVEDVLANVPIYYSNPHGPKIIPKMFCDWTKEDLPERISFAHFDCNFYQSTMQALRWAHPRMSIGAVGVIDDFYHPELHGPMKAAEDFGLMGLRVCREPGGERSSHVIFMK
jgi:hypothetical protein